LSVRITLSRPHTIRDDQEKQGQVERRFYWTAPAPPELTVNGEWADLSSIGMVVSERALN